MNITTRAQDFELTRAMDQFVRDELRMALARIDADVVSIDVFLKDVNGPRGGAGMRVLIRANMRHRQQLTLVTTHADMYAAILRGIKRTKRAVRRHLRKSRHFEKRRVRELLCDAGMTALSR